MDKLTFVLVVTTLCICPLTLKANDSHEQKCSQLKCPANEVTSCYGGSSELTCQNYFLHPRPCDARSEPKCVCDKGLVRNSHGKCIPLSKCSPKEIKCPYGEVVEECGKSWDKVCGEKKSYSNRRDNCHGPIACICKQGFFRNPSSKICVPEAFCPRCENDYEHSCKDKGCDNFIEVTGCCGKNHEKTCQNFLQQPLAKKKPCGKASCVCADGLVRRSDGACVPFYDCPFNEIRCGKHETPSKCGKAADNICGCEKSNFNRHGCEGPIECVCESGYYRNPYNKKCVLKSDCPKDNKHCRDLKCKRLTEVTNCFGNKCELTCDNYLLQPLRCEHNKKNPTCVCAKGLVRRKSDGECVLLSECPIKELRCHHNEEVEKCGAQCDRVCGREIRECKRSDHCHGPPACICKEGFYRDPITKACVSKHKCPFLPTKPKKCHDQNCNNYVTKTGCCGKKWEYTCANFLKQSKFWNEKCHSPSCICADGLVRRHRDKKCVPFYDCPLEEIECPTGEKSDICGKSADRICHQKEPNNRNTDQCRGPVACVCRDGLYRDPITKKCVEKYKCKGDEHYRGGDKHVKEVHISKSHDSHDSHDRLSKDVKETNRHQPDRREGDKHHHGRSRSSSDDHRGGDKHVKEVHISKSHDSHDSHDRLNKDVKETNRHQPDRRGKGHDHRGGDKYVKEVHISKSHDSHDSHDRLNKDVKETNRHQPDRRGSSDDHRGGDKHVKEVHISKSHDSHDSHDRLNKDVKETNRHQPDHREKHKQKYSDNKSYQSIDITYEEDSKHHLAFKCPDDHEFEICGLKCDRICNKPEPKCSRNGYCPGKPACICKKGLYRCPHTHECVPKHKCPKVLEESSELECKETERSSKCGYNCEKTCLNYLQKTPCVEVCGQAACTCRDGYVRRGRDSRCVRPKECPIEEMRCSGNQEATKCGPECERYFGNKRGRHCDNCHGTPRCICKEGFYRCPQTKKCIARKHYKKD